MTSIAQTTAPTAQDSPEVTCHRVLAQPFVNQLDPRIEADCDSTAYYFGIDRPKDYEAARACAYMERNAALTKKSPDTDAESNMFYGPGVLSMVYANGEGTARNLDLARRFVCESRFATPSEMATRLRLLDRIAVTPTLSPHFDLCNTADPGPSEGWCASVQVRLNEAKRYAEMVKIFETLTPKGQDAFKALQAAESAFEQLRIVKEVDLTGTARAAFSLRDEDRLRTQYVSDLKLIAEPGFSQPVTLAVAQAALDKEYANVRANGPKIFANSTITVAGVEETQRAWVKLVAAWRNYVAVAYPGVSGDAVATQLTRERLHYMKLLSAFR